MNIYQALEKVIRPQAGAYKVGIPFQSAPVDLKTGYISFFEINRRNIVGRSEAFTNDGTLETSMTEEVTVQIDVVKLIDNGSVILKPRAQEAPGLSRSYRTVRPGVSIEQSARETAARLKTYLSTREAMEAFYALGWELAPVWEEIRTDGWFGELKRWEERSFFRLKFYRESYYTAPDTPLEAFKVEIKPV